jgi:hypothetical protein
MSFIKRHRRTITALAAVGALATATAAWAAVVSASESGSSRAGACQAAKSSAARSVRLRSDDPVERYGPCECSRDSETTVRSLAWTCTVDAYYTPRAY